MWLGWGRRSLEEQPAGSVDGSNVGSEGKLTFRRWRKIVENSVPTIKWNTYLISEWRYLLQIIIDISNNRLLKSIYSPGVAQWIEYWPANQGFLVWFPLRAHGWVAGQIPQYGAHERQPHIDVSLPLFLLPFPSLRKQINKILKTNKQKTNAWNAL